MASKKKLQVFVSSTFTDLKEERQAAVEAILKVGHIPAGMELFAAGDQSQWEVIKRWIDESDVYLLILGGRYGTIDTETGKSYTHLEYEYAVGQNKPFFAVVMDDEYLDKKVKANNLNFIERENNHLLKEFKAIVTSKMVSFFKEIDHIKLAIWETLSEFSRREDLIGWMPGDQGMNSNIILEGMARLTQENEKLRNELALLRPRESAFTGLSFDELIFAMKRKKIIENAHVDSFAMLRAMALKFNDEDINLLHFFYAFASSLDYNVAVNHYQQYISELKFYDLVEGEIWRSFQLSSLGKAFFTKIHLNIIKEST